MIVELEIKMGKKRVVREDAARRGKGPDTTSIMTALEIEDKPIVINQWDGATVKNTLDDCVHKYTLDALDGFEEDFFETDMRLLVCFLGCAFAGFACIWGFLVPHPASTPVVSICVIGYFTLVSLLSFYQTFFEEPTLLCAKKDSQSLKVFTFMERYSTTFNVVIEVAGADKKPHNISENYDIANYFYGDGELAHGNVAADIEDLVAELLKLQNKDSDYDHHHRHYTHRGTLHNAFS